MYASDFALTTDATTPVAAGGGTTTFTITFDPSAVGLRAATVGIDNDEADENSYNFDIQGTGIASVPEIDVSGNGMSIPNGDTTPQAAADTDFGQHDVLSGAQTNTFTITNSGFAVLNLTAGPPLVAIGGTHASDFTLTTDATTPVASAGGTTTFMIAFDPSANGLRAATVSIDNDDANENPYTFDIQGKGMGEVIWTDDFESTAPTSGDRDAPNHADMDNGEICADGDYFVRTSDPGDGTTNGFDQTFSNIQDSNYWRAEDLNACITNPDVINWTGMDITGRTDLLFTGFFGANALFLGGAFNADDFIRVEADIDGGGFSTILEFQGDEKSGAGSNGDLRQDTDSNGVGDGVLLIEALASFCANISGTGTALSVRITASVNSGSEEIAFDHFTVESTLPEADLSITKVDDNDPVLAGDTLTYTVTVNNAGPSMAENVVVTDTLPMGVTFVSTSGCAEDPSGVMTCTLGNIAAEGSAQYTIEVTVDAGTSGVIPNQASVASDTGDPDTGNNTVSEDTTVFQVDYGDAPDPLFAVAGEYPTLLVSDGARHLLDGTTFLGTAVDAEFDGQQSAMAVGDDTDAGGDDEDGVMFTTPLVTCETAGVMVEASVAGLLNAWVDFNFDGDWSDLGEQIFTDMPLAAGPNSLMFSVPCAQFTPNLTYARFRFDSGGGLSPTGSASDGEVEDYTVQILGLDFSDAPDPLLQTPGQYPTLVSSDGARHVLDGGAILGEHIDPDADGQPNAAADGDDTDGFDFDDEDGVTFTSALVTGFTATVDVEATAAGLLNAWADFNADGDWIDAGEQIFTDEPLAAGVNSLTFSVPADATVGSTYTRFRFDQGGGLAPDGIATDGEVEDYQVQIAPSADLSISKIDDVDPIVAGNTLTYTVTVNNAGPQDAVDVVVTDMLPAGVTFVSSSGCAEDPSGVPTCSLGNIAAGGSAQFTIEVAVDPMRVGTITNQASVSSDTDDPDTSNNSVSEDTEVVPPITLTKSFTDDPVFTGDAVTLEFTIENLLASQSISDISFTDDLDVVVSGLVAVGLPLSDVCGAGSQIAGTSLLTFTGGSLAPAPSCTFSVTLQVPAGVSAGSFTNTTSTITGLLGSFTVTGNSATDDLVVERPMADLSISKADDVDPIVAGNVLTYVLTVDNAGPQTAENVVVSDTLPAGVTFVSSSGCAEDPTGVPTCLLGDIAAGGVGAIYD